MILIQFDYFCSFSEQNKKDSEDIDHDAIAHRLKQDVVSMDSYKVHSK